MNGVLQYSIDKLRYDDFGAIRPIDTKLYRVQVIRRPDHLGKIQVMGYTVELMARTFSVDITLFLRDPPLPWHFRLNWPSEQKCLDLGKVDYWIEEYDAKRQDNWISHFDLRIQFKVSTANFINYVLPEVKYIYPPPGAPDYYDDIDSGGQS